MKINPDKNRNVNCLLASAVLEALTDQGVREYCVCPGARNAPLVALLKESSSRVFYFFDERSAAFFALGRIRCEGRPVAVVTTSGTAVGELLPATMEAFYSGLPLVLLTADRPRSFRGTGAPQTAEQVGIFGPYVAGSLDLEGDEYLEALPGFSKGPALRLPFHVNVCFDEPLLGPAEVEEVFRVSSDLRSVGSIQVSVEAEGQEFLKSCRYPMAIVSLLPPDEREGVAELLLKLRIPTYFEGISGLREDSRLDSFRFHDSDRMMERAFRADYPVDGVLRIGSVPTLRFWRDLERKYRDLRVLSLSSTPYSGLSRSSVLVTGRVSELCRQWDLEPAQEGNTAAASRWIAMDHEARGRVEALLAVEPQSEPGMVFALSRLIAAEAARVGLPSRVYLGNSLPIREWDLAASREVRIDDVWASRGLNGIDGQISTFLGYAEEGASNWALIGDLTALYDLQGPWALSQLGATEVNLVIMNNGGGKIFSKLFSAQEFQNSHQLSFSALAELWDLDYRKWKIVPDRVASETLDTFEPHETPRKSRLIELVPDEVATSRFWKAFQALH